MGTAILFIAAILLSAGCSTAIQPKESARDRLELIPEPDKVERLRYEAMEQLRQSGCAFADPDTSLSGITLRSSARTTKIIGDGNQPDSLEQYHFYTKLDRETLTLTQHPGDGKNQISVFKVEYSDKADYGYRQLPIDTLKTEKGIKLGWSKKQIVGKLGTCYAALDSGTNAIELYYRIALPDDSKTGLLKRHNMPVYYASYKLWNDRLERFEFGFEYP